MYAVVFSADEQVEDHWMYAAVCSADVCRGTTGRTLTDSTLCSVNST